MSWKTQSGCCGVAAGDKREAVSSLLNITDGLKGRMLRLHIICSGNAEMVDLDPAVLRPGRLMNHRRFALAFTWRNTMI
jgi:ATP-dependent 26S proteasome regulatory subunit